MRTSTITVPNDIACLQPVQAYGREIAKRLGFPEPEIEKILLALEEAVVNVIRHAFEPDEETLFNITFEPIASGLRVIIKDKGLPFAPEQVPEYKLPADLAGIPGTGLGSFLMKKSVDEIAFYNLGREGKELHLVKHLPYKSIVDYNKPSELEPFPGPTKNVAPSEKKEFRIRLMEPTEVYEVSKLFYRAYGYTYGIEIIYYPERFAQALADKSIISVVTVDSNDHIAGHAALVKDAPDSKIAEAAMAVVQPDFRGYGCQNAMISSLVEEGKKAGLKGIYSKAVTNHVYAQKAGLKAGFKRCALVAGLIPADRSFKGIHSELSQRETVIYGFIPITDRPGITLYPPEHHREFIQKIYGFIGLERDYRQTKGSEIKLDEENNSLVKTTLISTYNRAIIEIHRYGEDITPVMKGIIRDLRMKKIDEITLFLNLEDPVTPLACERFEELGFFIAGALPFSHVGDALILQYLNNVFIDYGKIQIASEMGQEILTYVRSHDPNAG